MSVVTSEMYIALEDIGYIKKGDVIFKTTISSDNKGCDKVEVSIELSALQELPYRFQAIKLTPSFLEVYKDKISKIDRRRDDE